MKNKNIIYIILALLVTVGSSCDDYLDLKPYDALTADQLLLDEAGVEGMANGALGMMKDLLGDNTNNVYVRVLFQTTEFPSDNVLIVKSTTDPLWRSFNRAHTLSQENTSYLWATGYKIILSTNNVINNAVVNENTSASYKQLIGENYFYRAVVFFDLARVFSFPPSHGLDNNGIILKTRLDHPDEMARATVGQTYDQIISDLNKSVELMTSRASAPSKYGNKEAAIGYLTRAYLFTEDYDLVIENANKILDGNSSYALEPNESYVYGMQNTASSKEALFIIYQEDAENKGTGAIGSMYNADGGWGEVFPSAPFYNLLRSNPNDVRNDLITTLPGELYPGTSFEKRYVTKFSYQNGVSMSHSPIFLRLSEVLLNRAEAYAHTSEDQKALDDVNAIRERAGLTGDELITLANLSSTHGFASVLDAVLNERRLELAFEGHRRDDLMRNKIDLDRSFESGQNVDGASDIYPYDGARQIYYIPASVEIAYNPLCEQND